MFPQMVFSSPNQSSNILNAQGIRIYGKFKVFGFDFDWEMIIGIFKHEYKVYYGVTFIFQDK